MYYVLLVIALTCQYSGFIINKTLLRTQLSNGKTKLTTLYEPMKIAGKIKYTWVDNLPPGVLISISSIHNIYTRNPIAPSH